MLQLPKLIWTWSGVRLHRRLVTRCKPASKRNALAGAANPCCSGPLLDRAPQAVSTANVSYGPDSELPRCQLSHRHQGHCGPSKIFSNEQSLRTRSAVFFGASLDSEIALDAGGLIAVDRDPARIVLLPRDISFLGCLAISKQSAGKRWSITTCLRVLEGRFTGGRF